MVFIGLPELVWVLVSRDALLLIDEVGVRPVDALTAKNNVLVVPPEDAAATVLVLAGKWPVFEYRVVVFDLAASCTPLCSSWIIAEMTVLLQVIM